MIDKMEKTIDYAEEYLQLKNKGMWHKAETYAQLKENSLKEKAQFNDFVNFKVKQERKQLAEEIWNIISNHCIDKYQESNFDEELVKKIQKEVE